MLWMDLLRGGAVVLVVIFHAGNTPIAPQPVHMFNEAIGDSRLAALFVASGLLLDRSLAKGPSRYVSGKLRLIVWPYLIWTALMIPLSGRSRPLELVWWIWPSGSHTWFLITLATIYALGFLTRIVRPGWIVFALVVASQFIDRGGFELGPYVHHVTWFGAFFFLGVTLVQAHRRRGGRPGMGVRDRCGRDRCLVGAQCAARPTRRKDPARSSDRGDSSGNHRLGTGEAPPSLAVDAD